MFIKIVSGDQESVYECLHYRVKPKGEGKDSIRALKGRPFVIDMEGGCDISIEISKDVPEAMAVYAMNDRGQTIDTIFYKTKTKKSV